MKHQVCDLFFNLGSGSQADSRFHDLKDHLVKNGLEVRKSWRVGENLKFADALREMRESDTPLVVVAGGDGTLSGVSGTLVETGKVMGAVPSGTFNYFARNHKIPETMPEAVANLMKGTERRIPIGKVNDRYFLNNSSFGLYPTALKKREKHYKRWGRGRVIACLSLISTLMGRHKIYRTVLRSENGDLKKSTPFVFVGVNEFQLEAMGLRGQRCLDQSKLAIYITHELNVPQRVALTVKALFRNLENADEYRVTCASSLSVELRKAHVNVAIDGEVRNLEAPLEFSLLPEGLKVILPS